MARRIRNRRLSTTARKSSFNGKSKSSINYAVLEPRKLLAADSDVISRSPDGQWLGLATSALASQEGQRYIQFSRFGLFDLQEESLAEMLVDAPLEFTPGYENLAVTISVPRPDLTFARFRVVEAPIMEPELAAQFPDIKTYRGTGIDDPSATIRLDTTMHGFHAQVLSPNGTWYVDPYFHLQTAFYASYFRDDAQRNSPAGNPDDIDNSGCGNCGTCGACMTNARRARGDGPNGGQQNSPAEGGQENFGTQLRTFRLANAATGEYTAFHGGTQAAGQAAIVTAINRVTGLYEKDLAIRLTLVGNNSNLVYTNAGTDPYTNNNGSTMLGQNQTTVDAVIGNANYDIGHVFSTGGGGIAGLGVVGFTGSKARGVTGQPAPVGDPFYIDYVAHEMGHQFNGNHSFNGCSGGGGAPSAQYEPGSGSTIMSYAGICGSDNLQSNSDAMFNFYSIQEIRTFITATIPGVGAPTATGNSVPTVNAGLDKAIPTGTPFELTAVGSDANAGQTLTYSWEQRDLGPSQALTAADNGQSPLFRVWNPTTSPTRVFPRLSNLVNNTLPIGEKLPTVARPSMDFRVVVRDNASGGGGVNWDDMVVNVVNTGAAFSVTSQNAGGTWTGLTSQTITWNVAGTSTGTINTPNVDIWLSEDGGLTYTTLLASATPNDGSHAITVPNISQPDVRIKVKGTNNIFFDINNANITVTPVTVTPTVNVSGPAGPITEGDSGTSSALFVISLSQAGSSAVSVDYTLSNAGFSNPATPGSDYATVGGTAVFNVGETVYNIPVTIFGDRFTEGIEQFRMTISNPVNANLGISTVAASIADDDAFALGRPIDFGTATSPVQAGASGFSTNGYSAAVGMGWTTGLVYSREMTIGDDLTRDLVFAGRAEFRVDLPNGNYQVQAIFGVVDYDATGGNVYASYSSFGMNLEGVVHSFTLPEGNNVSLTFPATVADGNLSVRLVSGLNRSRISGLVVTST
jgi:Metallo-peptidase family M12B Reprolysin-like/Calx-beta domain